VAQKPDGSVSSALPPGHVAAPAVEVLLLSAEPGAGVLSLLLQAEAASSASTSEARAMERGALTRTMVLLFEFAEPGGNNCTG
jgi:hypothetical protein